VSLRDAAPDDESFLFAVYASTRTEELALVDWPEAQKSAFLQQQFAAQHHHYHTHYSGAAFRVILVDDVPAGRLYVARWHDEIRIVDVALLPAFRRHGIGTQLLCDLLEEGRRSGRRVSIHVESHNPAQHLYERLGFSRASQYGIYWLMVWEPSKARAMASDGMEIGAVARAAEE
jgi:ribosomal protein S18 acetylase RimI-like enzyme